MEIEKAIDVVKTLITVRKDGIIKQSYETILKELEKKDKMIELMAECIDTELSSEHLSKVLKIEVKPLETYREDIKQYFEKKAEEIS